MPCFGGFCPMPMRLGGGETQSSWQPGQHARTAADVAAMVRSKPFATILFRPDTATGLVIVAAYNAQHGTGIPNAPTCAFIGVGHARLTWAAGYSDDYGVPASTRIRHARVTIAEATRGMATYVIVAPNVVDVYTFNGAAAAADYWVELVVK